MTFFKRLLRINKKTGLIFVCDKGFAFNVGSQAGLDADGQRFMSFEDIEAGHTELYSDMPKPADWILIIPTYQGITKYSVIPSKEPVEIERILEFELPNIVSYNTQPWIWDFSVIDKQPDGASKVMVVLSLLNIINSYMKILQPWGIKPAFITTTAMFGTFLLNREKALQQSTVTGCFWLSDEWLDFFLIKNSKVIFSRGVQFKDKFHNSSGFVETEIQQSFSVVKEHKFSNKSAKFFAINEVESIADFTAIIKKTLDISASEIEYADLYNKGLTSADCLIQINLLPRDLKEKRLNSNKRRQIIGHGLKICMVLLLLFLCLKTSIRRKNNLLERYRERLTAIKPMAEKLQLLEQQLFIIENQLQGNISALDIIFELYRVLPEDITIHYLVIEQNKKIVLRAQAKLLSEAFDCIGPLEQSDYFENVRGSYANQRQIEDSVLIDFEITAELLKESLLGDRK